MKPHRLARRENRAAHGLEPVDGKLRHASYPEHPGGNGGGARPHEAGVAPAGAIGAAEGRARTHVWLGERVLVLARGAGGGRRGEASKRPSQVSVVVAETDRRNPFLRALRLRDFCWPMVALTSFMTESPKTSYV